MTQPGTGRTFSLSTSQVVVLGLAVLLLVGGAATGGVAGALTMAGLLVFVVGLVAVFRGQLPSMSIVSRRIGWAVAGAGFVALVVGGAVSPKPTAPASSQQALVAPHTSASPTQDTVTSSSDPATVPSQAATSSSEAAPSTSSAAPTTKAAPVLPAAPVMEMTCPSGGTVAAPQFGHRIAAAAPYNVVIDYGDGDRYTNDDQHLGAIFSHNYVSPGTFTVAAVLTDAAGQSTRSTCAYSWSAPVRVVAPVPAGGGGGSGSGDTYTNVDGNTVHSPVTAPVAPSGATAKCNDGTWSFSQHHSGTCSHHGGVAEWL